ncbi:DNA polymerase III subunit epsilon [Candidatus Annandia adelgestsuga]|uniref:DNA polymerase III subunit epsilon n=1 Tax=Candidatus Annandia adelgestsuga TaxID=1302411 RepID=A0A3Q9CLJ2_9ENTR|nr:DNA polymerase III subunit epsilon [Candidatus Annandia adelgestsuga]AZP36158.1 DNA polymerase III subunit epsilon [Candidatus Annandia adelgestsuga]
MRQIILDTETTGINKNGKLYKGHRIIEIGAIEIINRKITGNNFHTYINPERKIEIEAFKIHGISNSFLKNKPLFKDIYHLFLKYILNSELIIHNAIFDIQFLENELYLLSNKYRKISDICNIIDSLNIARKLFPGKKNNLDILSKRFNIKIKRKKHSALNDALILSKIYLYMTRGQTSLNLLIDNKKKMIINNKKKINKLKIIYANKQEILQHEKYLKLINKKLL